MVSVSISSLLPIPEFRSRDIHELIGIIESPAEGRGAVRVDQRDGGIALDGRRRTAERQAESAVGLAGRIGAGLGLESFGEELRLAG